MNAPQAALPQGDKKRAGSRGAFKLNAEGVAAAERKFSASLAAVKVAITGADLREVDVPLVAAVASIERAFAIYVACVVLDVPKKYLAAALKTSPRRVRDACALIEAWRSAPVISDALGRVETALPGAL